MFGGNDSNNTIVPTGSGYSGYSTVRGGLALPQNTLLPVTADGNTPYGLHPSLVQIKQLYEMQKKVAMIFNVGTLVDLPRRPSIRMGPSPFREISTHIPINNLNGRRPIQLSPEELDGVVASTM